MSATPDALTPETRGTNGRDPSSHSLRRYLRLSLYGLIILVLVIGSALGWLGRQAYVQRDAVAAIREAGGDAAYDIDPAYAGFSNVPGWRKRLAEYVGIDFVSHVYSVWFLDGPANNESDFQQALSRLRDLPQLKHSDP